MRRTPTATHKTVGIPYEVPALIKLILYAEVGEDGVLLDAPPPPEVIKQLFNSRSRRVRVAKKARPVLIPTPVPLPVPHHYHDGADDGGSFSATMVSVLPSLSRRYDR